MSFHESLSIATKLPSEIWTTVLNFAFDPNEEYFYSSRKAIINVLSEVSHDFHRLIKKLGISTATEQPPHADENIIDCIACYCCANGFGSLLEHALKNGTRPTNQASFIASRSGSLDCLKILEEHGFTLPESNLREASLHGHINIVKYLMGKGMKHLIMAVAYAVQSGNIELVKFMQSPELDIGQWDLFTEYATASGSLEMVKYIEQYLPLAPSSIHGSATKGSIEILQYYIDKGFTLTENVQICTVAAEHKQWKYLKFALDHGAPMSTQLMTALAKNNAVERMRELRAKGCPWDVNAVIIAASTGHLEALKYLVENGCPFTEVDPVFGENTLAAVITAINGHIGCLKYLIEIGAPMPNNIMHQCISTKNFAILKYLHDCGYSWSVATTVAAVRVNNVALLKFLHENNCPWDERTSIAAAREASIECLVYALENGCPWNSETINSAAVSGSLEALKICREKGLPWNDLTCTCLIQYGNVEMLKYAHENGAPWTCETIKEGIDVMVWTSCFDCFKYAIDHGCPWDPQRTFEVALSYKSCHRDIAQWILENYDVTKPKDASD